jgi:RND family efflux transporter MFP subunit
VQASPVVAAPVVAKTVTAVQMFVGSIAPTQRATIGSAVDGRVIECPFEEGDPVDAGQTLAQLLTSTISLELKAAQGELEFRKQQLAELENGARPQEIEQARARMQAAVALRDFRQARRERLQRVSQSRGAVSEDQLDEAQATAIEAEELFAAAKAAHDLTIAGPRQEVIDQARAQVAIGQANVDRLSDQIQKHTIVSRFAGYVVKQYSEVGQWVNRGDPIAEVVAIRDVEIVAQVVEQSTPFIVPGTVVRVEVPAVATRMFEGTVVTTVPQGDVRARTFPVKVRVANQIDSAGPLLKPGMYARVALPVGRQEEALLVPKDAIVLGQAQPLIYVISVARAEGDEGQAMPVPVELGVAQGEWIQVYGSLEPGQLVVVQGNERLRPAQRVIVRRVVKSLDSSGKR